MRPPRFWFKKNLLTFGLWPFSLIYRFIVNLRRGYLRFCLKTQFFPVPIVVVGNVTLGGTGKTSFVIWLSLWLKEKGFSPGIVSRGYGRTKTPNYPIEVPNESASPNVVGDEAVLIVSKTTCPMVVDTNRPRAVEYLLQQHDCDVVISDDGLQHYALKRDIEIALVDKEYLGNGYCLPAGPLREPLSRLNSVDFIVGRDKSGPYYLRYHPLFLYRVGKPAQRESLTFLRGKKIHAFCAIGRPKEFIQQLERLGAEVTPHIFPDHYLYRETDFSRQQVDCIVMTEKDAVKCQDFAIYPLWCLAFSMEVPDVFKKDFEDRLNQILKGKKLMGKTQDFFMGQEK